jgi:hypothetical protein
MRWRPAAKARHSRPGNRRALAPNRRIGAMARIVTRMPPPGCPGVRNQTTHNRRCDCGGAFRRAGGRDGSGLPDAGWDVGIEARGGFTKRPKNWPRSCRGRPTRRVPFVPQVGGEEIGCSSCAGQGAATADSSLPPRGGGPAWGGRRGAFASSSAGKEAIALGSASALTRPSGTLSQGRGEARGHSSRIKNFYSMMGKQLLTKSENCRQEKVIFFRAFQDDILEPYTFPVLPNLTPGAGSERITPENVTCDPCGSDSSRPT